jgi:hypothetical protein
MKCNQRIENRTERNHRTHTGNGTENKKEIGGKRNTETENMKCCKKQDRGEPRIRKLCGGGEE